MTNTYTHRSLFTTIMTVSLISGILMLATNHLDFIISAVEYNKLNIANIAYFILRIISAVILPAIFIVPSLFPYGRMRAGKAAFIACGVLQLITLTWIFYFMAQNSFAELFNNSKIAEFQSDTNNAFVSSYVFWDTYSWQGSLFSLMYGVFCIYTGLNLDDNRIRVRRYILILFAAKLLLPILSNLFSMQQPLSMFWITNNYADLISFAAFTIAILSVSYADSTWIEFIWDQPYAIRDEADNLD